MKVERKEGGRRGTGKLRKDWERRDTGKLRGRMGTEGHWDVQR